MLIYDGDCGMCTRCARWAEKRLPPGEAVVPWQAVDDLGALGLTVDDVQSAAWWVAPDGSLHRGHLAVAEGLRACGKGWRPIGRALRLPVVSPLAAVAYRWVARNRDRFPGGTAACKLPPTP